MDSDPNYVSSLSGLSSLEHLESLDLEETRIKDSALAPLPSFRKLSHLFLRSGSLADTTLHQLSSITSLVTLGIRDGVLTNTGLYVFNPPPPMKILDLRGCWLLTEDALLSFQQRHPQIEVRHDLLSIAMVKRLSFSSPLSQATPWTKLHKNKKGGSSTSPLRSIRDGFLGEALSNLSWSKNTLFFFPSDIPSFHFVKTRSKIEVHQRRTTCNEVWLCLYFQWQCCSDTSWVGKWWIEFLGFISCAYSITCRL